jgi:hypothetical protein
MTVASGQLSGVRKKRAKIMNSNFLFWLLDNYLADNICSRRCAGAGESCSDRLANCFPFASPARNEAFRQDCVSLVRLSVRVG